MSAIVQLSDLMRMRAIENLVRIYSDEQVADLLTTEEGQWFFVECAPHMAADVAKRVVGIVCAGTLWKLPGVTPEKS